MAFIEKPPRDQAPSNLINAGTYVLEPSILARIPSDRPASIERETFPALVPDGRLYAWASDAAWVDAGTPAAFLAANLRYAAGTVSTDQVGAGATVTNSVLGEGVKVGPGASVASSVCFDGAVIAADAQVRCSIVGRGARIEAGAVVTDLSVVGDAAVVPAGAHLSAGRVAALAP